VSALVSVSDDLLAAARTISTGAAVSGVPFALDVADRRGKAHARADTRLAASARTAEQDFPERIRLLIGRAGGVGALARCCGVTARTVNNWSRGRGDISRHRCVVLARAMGISALWLVSGEGGMTADDVPAANAPAHKTGVDAERLAAALQMLQSYIVLAGGALSVAQRAEAIVELYTMLAEPPDATRVIAFHKKLAGCLRGNGQAPPT